MFWDRDLPTYLSTNGNHRIPKLTINGIFYIKQFGDRLLSCTHFEWLDLLFLLTTLPIASIKPYKYSKI